jgi:Xaa-Pro dipeptidase
VEGPARSIEPGLRSLRTARNLLPGMILTVEPGCYFIHMLLEQAFACPNKSKYLNEKLIREEFWNFGGVRLEDDVLVTAGGAPPKNLTTCPRTIEEVESVCNGGNWPPAIDAAPYLFRQWGALAIGGLAMHRIELASTA